MAVYVKFDNDVLEKASANYLKDADCYEVELIRNPIGYGSGHDTDYRIEFIDNDYIDITKSELKALKEILNSGTVSKLLGLENIETNPESSLIVNKQYWVEGRTVDDKDINEKLQYRGKLGAGKYVFTKDGTGLEFIFKRYNVRVREV